MILNMMIADPISDYGFQMSPRLVWGTLCTTYMEMGLALVVKPRMAKQTQLL